MAYNVSLTRRAEKQLDALPNGPRLRVAKAIQGLCDDPRPRGCKKVPLDGDPAWRITVGDYRVRYLVDDDAGEVRVFWVGPRKDAYRLF